MATKTSRMMAAPEKHSMLPTRIEFVKRTVIGAVDNDPHGELDIMSEFFKAVEGDCREGMSPDFVSVEHYEMTDQLGTTKLTVEHTPRRLNR